MIVKKASILIVRFFKTKEQMFGWNVTVTKDKKKKKS